MDVLHLIEEIEDMIEDAKSVPLSKKVMIDPENFYDILKEIRQRLPEEIKQAKWITEEKERILSEARQEADEVKNLANKDASRIITEAQNRLQEMISNHDITKSAEKLAREIEAKAEQDARTISMQATTYIDDMFSNAQEKFKEMLTILDDSRTELRK